MISTDEVLAQRHGRLVAHAWRQVAAARAAARRDDPADEQLTRLRQVRRRVVAAHKAELLLSPHATRDIDLWFGEIEDRLCRAERYFQEQIVPVVARVQPPTSPPRALFPMVQTGRVLDRQPRDAHL